MNRLASDQASSLSIYPHRKAHRAVPAKTGSSISESAQGLFRWNIFRSKRGSGEGRTPSWSCFWKECRAGMHSLSDRRRSADLYWASQTLDSEWQSSQVFDLDVHAGSCPIFMG